jgi:hypothetical protein
VAILLMAIMVISLTTIMVILLMAIMVISLTAIMVILLMAIGGYFINGYWWLLY